MPTLTIIQGPDHGKTFDVEGSTSTIGRDADCEVPLRDPGASRRHARFEFQNGRCILRDLESANGTFVNGMRVENVEIHAGDQIHIGNTLLALGEPPREGPVVDHRGMPIEIDTEGRVDSAIITTVRAGDDPHTAFAVGEDMADMRTSIIGLRALYQIADMLARDYDTGRLLNRIMDMVFDIVDADRGFILLREGGKGPMVPRAVRYREELIEQIRRERAAAQNPADTQWVDQNQAAPPRPPICVSKTIINYVMRSGEGVLTTNAMQDQRFEEGESVQDFGIRSAICVPIKSRDAILGVLHVDTHVSQGQFTPDDLKLMTAIGCQTGLAVENALLMAGQVQQARLAAMGQAVASLSHSIKNILQGIQGGSHAVETGLDREETGTVRQGWEIVRRNLRRINALVLNMLSYSRQSPPNLQQMSVNAVVREVVELVQGAAREKQAKLTTKLDTSLPEIPIDPDGLHHACLNILTNAIEAVPAIQGRVEVATRLSPHGSEVWIAVADNGPGIPREQQPHIFNAFHSTKGHKGTGLGLAAAQKIARDHGGFITVNSQPGQGSAFVIHLPRK
ncbi:MAG: FHA domain-containing protein [Planctomycetes bacterium]|nr:FHA domain-containing protein [Planctomycetota bacterium]